MTSEAPDFLAQQLATVAIRAYAAHSYLYYEKDSPVISDGDFDALCEWLLENYDWIKQYDLNNYLNRKSLRAGTGFDIAPKVSGMTLQHALGLLETEKPKAEKPRRIRKDIEDLL